MALQPFGHILSALAQKQNYSQLDRQQCYQLNDDELGRVQQIFMADFCSDSEGTKYIGKCYDQGYLIDPHTATCFKAAASLELKPIANIICATAEWTKFSPVVNAAIGGQPGVADIDALRAIASNANIDIPAMISQLFDQAIAHPTVIDKADIEGEIVDFLRQSSCE